MRWNDAFMTRLKDLTGQRFGRLTVLYRFGRANMKYVTWLCRCDCGKTKVVRGGCLTNGSTKSCGCLHNEVAAKVATRHGCIAKGNKVGNHIYNIWRGMRSRCYSTKSTQYANYGGRGISVCEEWHDFTTFAEWAYNNDIAIDKQIDRIDCNGNYTPSNCRFVSPIVNANNKRNTRYVVIDNERLSVCDAARKYNCPAWRIRNRLKHGYSGMNLVKEHL